MNSKNILAAATALFLSNSALAAEEHATPKQEAQVMCGGINACKGTSECKTASNACKGMNACKGTGWVFAASAEECTKKGGQVLK